MAPVAIELIARRICILRGQKVMLDHDIADLYEVPTKAFNQAVRRNLERFPADFMFQLTNEEVRAMRSQTVTASGELIDSMATTWKRNARYHPYAFTEQGIAMLSSVLHSPRAIQVNIVIMRTFVKLRDILTGQQDTERQFAELRAVQAEHASHIDAIWNIVDRLQDPEEPVPPKRPIGFPAN